MKKRYLGQSERMEPITNRINDAYSLFHQNQKVSNEKVKFGKIFPTKFETPRKKKKKKNGIPELSKWRARLIISLREIFLIWYRNIP